MNKLKIIITGATGMVGEGVLLACLQNETVSEILMVNRRHYALNHPKLSELLIENFNTISEEQQIKLNGYDACFYCAGISSVGMKEEKYSYITYETTLHFAQILYKLNPSMVFNFVSGQATDRSENGKLMWARVKGKTENALIKIGFKGQYNFCPGFMKPLKGQKNVKFIFTFFGLWFPTIFPKISLTLLQVGQAMVNSCLHGYDKQILEVQDIKKLASISNS